MGGAQLNAGLPLAGVSSQTLSVTQPASSFFEQDPDLRVSNCSCLEGIVELGVTRHEPAAAFERGKRPRLVNVRAHPLQSDRSRLHATVAEIRLYEVEGW